MTRATQKIPTAMALLAALVGCTELSPPLAPIPDTTNTAAIPTPSPSPTPIPTPSPIPSVSTLGTVRGFVCDISSPSMFLAGARVTIGTASILTSDGSATAVDDNGKTFTLKPGEYWLRGIPRGDQAVSALYDDSTASFDLTVKAALTNIDATPSGANTVSTFFVPTLGPVATGSNALSSSFVLHGASSTFFQVAQATTSLSFPAPTIDIKLKAPPNSRGDTVGAYVFTYLDDQGAPLASSSPKLDITSVTVSPAAYNHSSSVVTLSDLDVQTTQAALFNKWTFNNNFATLKIDLYAPDGHHLVARDGSPLVIRIPCQLIH